MLQVFKSCCLLVLTTLIALSALSESTYAQTAAYDDSAITSRCDAIKATILATDLDKAYVVEYIVTCTVDTMRNSFTIFINAFYPIVADTITAAMTMAVLLFGVLTATGALEKPARDTFVALFKLASVIYFVQPSTVEDLYNVGLDMLESLTSLVYQFGSWGGGQRCIDSFTLWDKLDCTLDLLIGTVKDSSGSAVTKGVSRGLIHFFSASLSSTSLGAIIAMLGFYVTFTLLFATIKSIHTYLGAVMALSFLLMIAPLFIPMILFKMTRSYFDKWMRMCIAFVLQPVILFGFLSVMMIVMHGMLFQMDGSFMKTIIGADADKNPTTTDNVFVSRALEDQGVYGTTAFSRLFDLNDSSQRDGEVVDTGVTGPRVRNPAMDSNPDAMDNDSSFGKISLTWDAVQFEKLKHCGSAKECQKQIAMSIVTLALTAFVFISMLNYIPNLATDLAGGIYEVPNLYKDLGTKIPGADMLTKTTQGTTNVLTENLRGATSQFRSQLEGMLGRR